MKIKLSRVEFPFVMALTNESGNVCYMDAHPSIGGTNKGFRPMELLAGSLAGCASIDVLNILQKQRVELKHYNVRIEASRREGVPSPFDLIHLVFEFDKAVQEEKVTKVIEMALGKYCSVSASLNQEVKITYAVSFV